MYTSSKVFWGFQGNHKVSALLTGETHLKTGYSSLWPWKIVVVRAQSIFQRCFYGFWDNDKISTTLTRKTLANPIIIPVALENSGDERAKRLWILSCVLYYPKQHTSKRQSVSTMLTQCASSPGSSARPHILLALLLQWRIDRIIVWQSDWITLRVKVSEVDVTAPQTLAYVAWKWGGYVR